MLLKRYEHRFYSTVSKICPLTFPKEISKKKISFYICSAKKIHEAVIILNKNSGKQFYAQNQQCVTATAS